MGKNSKIEWTDHTFNSVWGCVKVSPGCKNCYAETLSKRTGENIWGVNSNRRQFGDTYWNKPLLWDKQAAKVGEVHKVFCASMADIGEDHDDWLEPRRRTFDLIEQTANLNWLLLTKRPANLFRFILEYYGKANIPENIWFGFSAENQEWFDNRWNNIKNFTNYFSVIFVSAEPLLGGIQIPNGFLSLGSRGWWIDGGESGPNARPMHPDWPRSHRDQCQTAGVPYFFKQWGEHDNNGIRIGKKNAGRVLDNQVYNEMPA
jgi:protein gp37